MANLHIYTRYMDWESYLKDLQGELLIKQKFLWVRVLDQSN